MKLAELIARAQSLKPSEYDKDEMTQWVNEVEFKAIDQVINRAKGNFLEYKPYKYELDADRELLIPDQFIGVYLAYISGNIDLHNAETDRYQLDAAQYDAEWNDYAAWYRRTYPPKHSPKDKVPDMNPYADFIKETERMALNLIGREY